MAEELNNQTRLNKYLSDTGICSRREADKLIETGRVTVNGKKPEVGTKVSDNDEIKIDGKPVKQKEKPIYIALNKPVGITSTTETHVKGNIIDFINHRKRIFPIGRLDKPSEGLIFLTNDGDIVNKILRAGNNHEKEYIVEVDKPITSEFISKMSNGVPILDTVTQKCLVEQLGKNRFRMVLTQGLNRQIRRMCEYLGYEVTRLKRTRIMNISLGDLPLGKWRYLTDKEIDMINALVASSVKTEEASHLTEKPVSSPPARSYSSDSNRQKSGSYKRNYIERQGGRKEGERPERGSSPRFERTSSDSGRNDSNRPYFGEGKRPLGTNTDRADKKTGPAPRDTRKESTPMNAKKTWKSGTEPHFGKSNTEGERNSNRHSGQPGNDRRQDPSKKRR